MSTFWEFTIRKTRSADVPLAYKWTPFALDASFWLKQDGTKVESFLVFHHEKFSTTPIAFFQIQHVGAGDQVRLHFQAGEGVSPKIILKGLTKLVPLIEKALALRGVKAIFFTSHSESMALFMAKRFQFRIEGDGGPDGVIMAKGVTR